MTTSARLPRPVELKLEQYCREYQVSKTTAIEQSLGLLFDEQKKQGQHPAFLAIQRLKLKPETSLKRLKKSSAPIKRAIRAKYPG